MISAISEKLWEAYWISRFGWPKRKITIEAISSDPALLDRPVFFLSTGRTGTAWFARVLGKAAGVRTFHNPSPNFSIQNEYVYRLWRSELPQEVKTETAAQIFLTGRGEYLRYAFKSDRRYIETNNHITFFAPSLAKLFPDAKFVWLHRHPGEFVRSGIRRGWFDQNRSASIKLIKPWEQEGSAEPLTRVQKISLIWRETNRFIAEFAADHEGRIIRFNFNDLDEQAMERLVDFLDIKLPPRHVRRMLSVRINKQVRGSHPRYDHWTEEDKEQLKIICGPLAEELGHLL